MSILLAQIVKQLNDIFKFEEVIIYAVKDSEQEREQERQRKKQNRNYKQNTKDIISIPNCILYIQK